MDTFSAQPTVEPPAPAPFPPPPATPVNPPLAEPAPPSVETTLPQNPLTSSAENQPPSSQFGPAPNEPGSTPTDLSHLITNTTDYAQSAEANLPSVSVPENLIVQPPNGNPEVPNIPTDSHKGIPKWLIGVGIGLLLVVAAASAFFILGIGQTSQNTTSLPASTQSPKPASQTSPSSSPKQSTPPSGGFGQFEGSPAASIAPTPKPATSAAELLKQRNQ